MKKSPKLKFSTFNGVNLEGFSPGIEYDKDNISDEALKNLANELNKLGDVSKFIRHRIDDFQNSISHIRITSSNEEQKYFNDFYIFDLLTKIKEFILDDKLLIDLTNNINKYSQYVDADTNSEISKIDPQKIQYTNEGKKIGLAGKNLDNYVKHQLIIFEKEQQKKAEEEAKLLGTEMQQLLPEIFENKRAIPNSFLRGALFGMVRKGRRALVKNEPIFTMSQYDLKFTGEYLDQNDLELWDTLIYLGKERCVTNELRITLYDLCKELRVSPNQERYKKIFERAERLKIATIKIHQENQAFLGSLINNVFIDTNGDGKLVIEYNKCLTPLFKNDYTYINSEIRHKLGDNQLARWLYSFYESHKKPIPFSISFLQKLCKSESQTKEFKRMLVDSLQKLKTVKNIDQIKWDYEITSNNFLVIYPTGKNKKQKQAELFDSF